MHDVMWGVSCGLQIKLAQRDYHEKERIKEEKKILHSIPSDRLKWTIKAYIG